MVHLKCLAKREFLLYRSFSTEGNSILKTTLLMWFLSGCTTPVEVDPNIAINPLISECGGFTIARSAGLDHGDGTAFCNDEMLHWEYNEALQMVRLVNDFVWLNCCGVRNVSVTKTSEGRYEMYQTDNPAIEGRCDCECSFDFKVDVSAAPKVSIGAVPTVLHLDIIREILDAKPVSRTVWSGSIDLTQISGEILIEEDVGWCF